MTDDQAKARERAQARFNATNFVNDSRTRHSQRKLVMSSIKMLEPMTPDFEVVVTSEKPLVVTVAERLQRPR